jgi:hypothetical protein
VTVVVVTEVVVTVVVVTEVVVTEELKELVVLVVNVDVDTRDAVVEPEVA